jgi:hypothetical protein
MIVMSSIVESPLVGDWFLFTAIVDGGSQPCCCHLPKSVLNGLTELPAPASDSHGGRDVHRGQDEENVGLHHAGQQTERRHDDRKEERRDGQQNPDDHRSAHHVAEQTDGQGQRAGDLADQIERQHDERRLRVGLEVVSQSPFLDAEDRHGHQHAQRQCRRGRERTGRRLEAREDGAEGGHGEEQKERGQKAERLSRLTQTDFFDLFLDGDDDDFEKVLPAGAFQADGNVARDEPGAHDHHGHDHPGEDQRGVQLDEPVLPVDDFVGTKPHDRPPLHRHHVASLSETRNTASR